MIDWSAVTDKDLLEVPTTRLAKDLGCSRQAVAEERWKRRKRAASDAFVALGGFKNETEAWSAYRTVWAQWQPTETRAHRIAHKKLKPAASDPVGRLLRELDDYREAQGLTRTDLGRKVGVDPGSIRALFGQGSARARQAGGVAALQRFVDLAGALGCVVEIRPLDVAWTSEQSRKP